MAKFLIPLQGRRRVIAPSLRPTRKALSGFDIYDGIEPVDKNTSLGLGEEASAIPDNEHLNPTVIPLETLLGFHFTFLIRHPRRSIPSLYRLSIPPKSAQTGWCGFSSYDAGYRELRILFDFLKDTKQIGPNSAGIDQKLGQTETEICVVDCDELLEDPEEVLETYCKSVGIPFEPCMLRWDKAEDRQQAKAAFEKWGPFHDTILNSTSLMSQPPVSKPFILCDVLEQDNMKMTLTKKSQMQTLSSPEEYMAEWTRIFGQEGAKIIQEDVDVNLGHYMYLKSFAIKARVGDKNNEKREYAKKDIQT